MKRTISLFVTEEADDTWAALRATGVSKSALYDVIGLAMQDPRHGLVCLGELLGQAEVLTAARKQRPRRPDEH